MTFFTIPTSRARGKSIEGIDLERLNWGGYDLVVIDESHNFRNGSDTSSKASNESEGNRYDRLLNKVLLGGTPTKVLMLSATPVNNRFRDLHNQVRLAYQGDGDAWSKKLGLARPIDQVFRNAQRSFKEWSRLDGAERTTSALIDMLDFDFFRILDQVTVARSRGHIQRYYDMGAIGTFPQRLEPISLRPGLSTTRGSGTYRNIASLLDDLTLAVYLPTAYLHPSAAAKYADEKGNPPTQGRERGMVRLMSTILLKRLESSVHAFAITLRKVMDAVEKTIASIDAYEAGRPESRDSVGAEAFDADDLMDEGVGEDCVGTKARFALADMDWKSWRRDMQRDLGLLTEALRRLRT